MLHMNRSSGIISTYAADVSGVCSALFEYGAMTVMHDASGCNSTYNTHDEPRWYDTDSLVFISALTEMEAVMGDDEKLILDICDAAEKLVPSFIAIAGTPIPMVMGTDIKALARVCEKRTGIKAFGFQTNGMHSYLHGASMAFDALAENFAAKSGEVLDKTVNIIGTTPLDFSVNGYVEHMERTINKRGMRVLSRFGMGGCLEDLKQAGNAGVNLVVSSCGLAAAKTLERKFGTPYIVGIPVYGDEEFYKVLSKGESCIFGKLFVDADTVIISEAVAALSLGKALYERRGIKIRAITPPDTASELTSPALTEFINEEHTASQLKNAKRIIADPLYKPICPITAEFISLPHEAFSGRIFRNDIPDLLERKELL